MDIKVLQLYCILTTLWTFVKAAERGTTCTTPNNEKATCVSLDNCKVILDAIGTFNDTLVEFAKKSQCGYDTKPLVCCGTVAHPLPTPTAVLPLTALEFPTANRKQPINLQFISSTSLPDRTLCGLERETPRLTGAKAAGIDEFPWMALIGYKDSAGNNIGFKCGGTLINNRYVLTAAHCILTDPEDFKPSIARLGEWKISEKNDCVHNLAISVCSDPVVDVKVVEEIPHPYYSSRNGNNDIGLLRLEHDITYSDFIRPICLPPINLPVPRPGTMMTVCGWGATDTGEPSDIKLKLEVPLVSNSECATKISKFTAITPNQVCAGGEEGKDACKGDSGGPLMRTYSDDTSQWYQEGVVSRGRGCGKKGFPGIYTRVARYIAWIVNNIADDSGRK